jgi:hypothetical protein
MQDASATARGNPGGATPRRANCVLRTVTWTNDSSDANEAVAIGRLASAGLRSGGFVCEAGTVQPLSAATCDRGRALMLGVVSICQRRFSCQRQVCEGGSGVSQQ